MSWRDRVVAEAVTWHRTPYHHQGFKKGHGVDCAFLLVKTYAKAGLCPDIDPRPYSPDWYMHRSEEKFKTWVEKFATRLSDGELPGPGDLALFKFGYCHSHGMIVLDWPRVIHAVRRLGQVHIEDIDLRDYEGREPLFYTFKEATT